MASHQISIRHEVYEQLKKAKLPDESFSDTIQRLLKKESNIEKVIDLYGTASVDDPEEEKILLEIY